MSAYIASNALGVVRQTLLNGLFGTGREANAFYAAAIHARYTSLHR